MTRIKIEDLAKGETYRFLQFGTEKSPGIGYFEKISLNKLDSEKKINIILEMIGGYISRDGNDSYHVWSSDLLGMEIDVPIMNEYIKNSKLNIKIK